MAKKQARSTRFYQSLEHVSNVRQTKTGLLADVDNEQVRVDVVRSDILRIQITRGGRFDDQPTPAVCVDLPARSTFTFTKHPDCYELSTDDLLVRLSTPSFSLSCYRKDGTPISIPLKDEGGRSLNYCVLNDRFYLSRLCAPDDFFYGLGEKTRRFNRNGNRYTLYNHDIFATDEGVEFDDWDSLSPEEDPRDVFFDPYYMSIPFFYHAPAKDPWQRMAGFFIDNGYPAHFEFDHGNDRRYRIFFEGGHYTEYIFAGPDMKSILEGYTWLTGRMQPPPAWALGYHQCRWYPYDQEDIIRLADTLRDKNIPCDCLWLDIDYMDEYRVFTWNNEMFPTPKKMLKSLLNKGFRTITIIDPGVKCEDGYQVYDEARKKNLLCKTESGQVYIGQVWPGRTAFPDFTREETRAWWGALNAKHVKSGLAGIWNDMNEPATGGVSAQSMRFDRDGRNHSHDRFHNLYALYMAMGTVEGLNAAMPNLRTFVLSRAGSAGIQRYAANWLGDNRSRWSHLAMSIPMALGLGVSGQPFVGADIGGFGESCTGELLARWTQAQALMPFCRNHNCDPCDQYPWSFGQAVEEICRDAIRLRYRLMPYLYTTFMQASQSGDPVMRPLLYDYPHDLAVRDLDDQFLVGKNLLVAPVLQEGARSRRVYLPQGIWGDWHTGTVHQGPCYLDAKASLDVLPIFVRSGAVLPMLETPPESTNRFQPKCIDLHIWQPLEDGETESVLHEDDGVSYNVHEGSYVRSIFTMTRKGTRCTLCVRVEGDSYPEFRRDAFCLRFEGVAPAVATVNGAETPITDAVLHLENHGEPFSLEWDV